MDDKLQQLLSDSSKGLRALAEAIEIIRNKKSLGYEDDTKILQPELIDNYEEVQTEIEPTPTLTLVEVRRTLAEKSREGFTEQIRNLLIKYGADKLSEIDPKNYAALVNEAQYLGTSLDDIKASLEKLKSQNCENQIKEVFAHHYATNLEDLKPEYYSSFIRDIEELNRG
jgi:UDP-N-acetylmuramyl pentapeptide synthase